MKTTQEYCGVTHLRDHFPEFALILAILFGILPFVLAIAAGAAPARPSPSSILQGPSPVSEREASILRGPASGPCEGASSGADYIGGADADGRPVPPAEGKPLATAHLDSETVYPLVQGGRTAAGTEIKVKVNGLANIMNAPTGCPPQH